MKNKQKGFAIIPVVTILVVLLIGGGVYVIVHNKVAQQNKQTSQNIPNVSPANNSIEEQKTYRNDINDFSFKYPSTINVTENGPHEITLRDSQGNAVARIQAFKEYSNEKCVLIKYEIGTQKISGSKEKCATPNTQQINYIIPLEEGSLHVSSLGTTIGAKLVEDIIKTIHIDFYDPKAITFVTPAASESLNRGDSFVVIWDGSYSRPLTLKIVSTVIGSKISSVVSDNVSSSNKRNQVVWDIPCDFDRSQDYFRLVFTDKNTGKVVANSPAFLISKEQRATCATTQTKTYSDTIFGFSFSYPKTWTISTDSTGTLSVGLQGSNVALTTIKKTSGTGTDSNGKFGSVVVSFNGSQWVRQQSNERDGGLTSPTPTTPVLYTASGLPIFSGAILTHGWGRYSYIVALSHTKFLTIEGSDNSVDGPYNPDNDPTLSLIKTVSSI
ncbi:MAG: hypothetical protein EXS51_01640 [Candidatus Taylorbacteria bacterium]|nr:hypothetical protein [Candidatus Taylorbacteria bacterium]